MIINTSYAERLDIWSIIKAGRYGAIKKYISNLTPDDVRSILAQKNKNKTIPNFESEFLLRTAKSNKNPIVSKMLISAGAKVNYSGEFNSRAIILASGVNKNVEVIKLLINSGADVNARGYKGETPLMHALRNKNLKVARYLIEAGADVKARDDKGNTTLLHLVKKEIDAPDIVKLLIDKGVDTTAENYYCRTAMQFAEACGLSATAKILENAGIEPSGKESTDKNCTNTKNHWGEVFCPYNPTPKTKKTKWYEFFK
jgi:ankyrin repeat protein